MNCYLTLTFAFMLAAFGFFAHELVTAAEQTAAGPGPALVDNSMTYALLAFGFGALILQAIVNIKTGERGQGWGPQSVRLFMLTIIVVFALVPVTVSISQNVAAPAYGLLGAIAGYLFGQSTTRPPGTP